MKKFKDKINKFILKMNSDDSCDNSEFINDFEEEFMTDDDKSLHELFKYFTNKINSVENKLDNVIKLNNLKE